LTHDKACTGLFGQLTPFSEARITPAGLFAGQGLFKWETGAFICTAFIKQHGRCAGIIVQLPAIHQQLVTLKIDNAMREATANDLSGTLCPP